MAKAKISIGTWAYLFNQKEPTNDFHTIIHKLQDLGYDGVELGSFGPHPSPASHPTKANRTRLKKEIADHGLALSGIAIDLWAFKTPGTSIMDETPSAYLTAFLGWCAFAADLADRGFIVFSPHNPYRGRVDFRILQRKLNPLGKTLYSVMIGQHGRILEWLSSLEFVDGTRIGFYGLSYGGKTAMRIPAIFDRYAVSICSGESNSAGAKAPSRDWPHPPAAKVS